MATDRQLLDAAINESRAQAASAVGSSRSGVDAILSRAGDVNGAISSMKGVASRMEDVAGTLQGYGSQMWSDAGKVMGNALDTLGTGVGFINMDASSSPLVAEALKIYGEFDPDRYVGTAAQDAQASIDNARGQTERSLARMGVNPSSGAAMAARSQLEKSLAVMKAAAMTRARQTGQNEQATWFQKLIADNANTFLGTGGSLANVGSGMQANAANAQKGAADVLGGAAGIYGDAGKLSLSYGNSLSDAWNALAGTQLNHAKNTNDTEAVRVSAVNGGSARGGSSVGGVNVTQAPEDDWMNWKGTGHSETWNKNHNPDFQALLNSGT